MADCHVTSLIKHITSAAGKNKKRFCNFSAKIAHTAVDSDIGGGGGGSFAMINRCKVVLFVAPTPRNLVDVQQVCNDVGMGTLVLSIM